MTAESNKLIGVRIGCIRCQIFGKSTSTHELSRGPDLAEEVVRLFIWLAAAPLGFEKSQTHLASVGLDVRSACKAGLDDVQVSQIRVALD